MKLIHFMGGVVLCLILGSALGEFVSNMIWDEYEEDCGNDEELKVQSYITKVGECVPKKDSCLDECKKCLNTI